MADLYRAAWIEAGVRLRDERAPSLLIGCLINLIYAIYLTGVPVIMTSVGLTFHIGLDAQARLYPASFGGLTLGVLLSGALSDRLGRKQLLLASIGGFAIGALWFAMARSFAPLLAAAALAGAGSGSMQTVSNALLSDLFPRRRELALSITQTMFGFGAFLGPFIILTLVHFSRWESAYIFMAIAGTGLFIWQAVQPVSNSAPQVIGAKVPWTNPQLLLLAVAAFLYSGCEVSYWGWVPKYLTALSLAALSAAVISVFWFAMTIGRALTSVLAARYSSTALVMTMMLTSACTALATIFAPHNPLVLVLVALTGLAMAGTYGLLLSLTANRFSTDAGATLGLVAAMGGAGGAVLPWLCGQMVKSTGWHVALLVPVVGDVVVVLLAAVIASLRRSEVCTVQ